ncbi:MAG: hypothetical protein J0H63_14185 [Rhizobiales bacterium]|nr:hypothetical protein [Hyphomicrobiales bacterium]
MIILDRRRFLGTMAAVAGASTLAAIRPASAADAPVGFPEASSNPLRWPFVMGLLVAGDAAAREAEIAALRDKTSYRRKLAYASSDRKKEAFAEALIAWFATGKDVRFAGLIVVDPDAKWPNEDAARDKVMASLCTQLIETAGAPKGLVLNIPDKRKTPRDRTLRALVPVPADGAPPDMPNLDQAARFLTGCLYGEAAAASQALKVKLTGTLKSALKVEALSAANLAGKFTVAAVAL